MNRVWVFVAVAVVAAGCSSGTSRPSTTTTSSSSTTSTTTALPGSDVTTATAAPTEYFAVSPDGHIVVVSVATGAVLRQMEPHAPPGAPSDLALSADRQTLFFSRGGHLERIPTAGGTAVPVGTLPTGQTARWPAPTPDGKYLAWVRTTPVANGMEPSDVMVTDLLTGVPRILLPNAASRESCRGTVPARGS